MSKWIPKCQHTEQTHWLKHLICYAKQAQGYGMDETNGILYTQEDQDILQDGDTCWGSLTSHESTEKFFSKALEKTCKVGEWKGFLLPMALFM